MRIALVAPPYLTVPPSDYGGIELVVSLLADGLVDRGHDVTLFASPGSDTNARLAPALDTAPGPEALADEAYGLAHVLRAYEDTDAFDVIHDHTLQGPVLAARREDGPPVVHTLHGPWTDAARQYYQRIHRSVHLVAISESQKADNPDVSYAGVVPNGIDLTTYPLREDKEDILVFIGRSVPDKGPELAVEVAHRAGLPLVMVAKRAEPVEQRHWDSVVAPRLQGDEEIIDAVGHDDKVELLGRARALLMPIQWPEPFGLVMTEAMACGTPVVARPLGAARELVADGVSGFLRDSVEEMAAAVAGTGGLSPRKCRDHVAASFSAEAMVDGYEEVFERVLNGS
ncbi:MAG: glycosyltransferase family 4 protein [Actinomycetota bacterium]|nr:glycosyltransferase family 4 protein [Actinomycetota bacterium]